MVSRMRHSSFLYYKHKPFEMSLPFYLCNKFSAVLMRDRLFHPNAWWKIKFYFSEKQTVLLLNKQGKSIQSANPKHKIMPVKQQIYAWLNISSLQSDTRNNNISDITCLSISSELLIKLGFSLKYRKMLSISFAILFPRIIERNSEGWANQ